MATSAVASAAAAATSSIAQNTVQALTPASPFAQLLRRSRFASFDPAIRQTYSSPPANAYRGDWGLKRPIALRRKNAFITLTSFESPAHYTEWNNAESQVRFVRRVEEMGTLPRLAGGTPWSKGLGKARTEWLSDSEFCSEEDTVPDLELASQKPVPQDLASLGKRGPGAYGPDRPLPRRYDIHVTPNIDAMSPREFVRYLRKLRSLRPAFQEHLKEQQVKNPDTAQKPIQALAQNTLAGYHRMFLGDHTREEYNDMKSLKIQQQPHPTAALTYSHPSPLDSYLSTKAQPGLVLQHYNEPRSHRFSFNQRSHDESFVASFGGISSILKKRNAGQKTAVMDISTERGIDQSRLNESIADLRVLPKGLVLEQPPRVVGQQAQGLKAVRVTAEVINSELTAGFGRDNPHRPGTTAYVAHARQTKALPVNFNMEATRLRAPPVAARRNLGARKNQAQHGTVLDTLEAIMHKKAGTEGEEESSS